MLMHIYAYGIILNRITTVFKRINNVLLLLFLLFYFTSNIQKKNVEYSKLFTMKI